MIHVITDSGCDLPDSILEAHAVEIIPLTVRFGDDEFVDRQELSIHGFWDRLLGEGPHPQTAAPSVGRFTEAYERILGQGADGIVVLCMSSAISATHRAAILAAEALPEAPVRVIDSRLVSAALGLAVIEACERAESGDDLDTVAAAAADACEAIDLYATLDTLEYLRRGGRIGGASALIGGLLDVKPLISFEVGEVTAAGRVRTRKRAIAAVLEHLADLGDRIRRWGVIHSDPPDLDEFLDAATAIRGAPELVARLGPVVGTHAGPGAAGIVYRLG
jgi:DegV family protein with EDD domain